MASFSGESWLEPLGTELEPADLAASCASPWNHNCLPHPATPACSLHESIASRLAEAVDADELTFGTSTEVFHAFWDSFSRDVHCLFFLFGSLCFSFVFV